MKVQIPRRQTFASFVEAVREQVRMDVIYPLGPYIIVPKADVLTECFGE